MTAVDPVRSPDSGDVGADARNGLVPSDARAMLSRVLGLPGLDVPFPCILPGSEGAKSAFVDGQTLRYVAVHGQAIPPKATVPQRYWSLAEVFASVTAGQLVTLAAKGTGRPNLVAARWWDRLRHEAGLLDVSLRPLALSPWLSPRARLVADGFGLAYALNGIRHPGSPAAFSVRFASAWCGVTFDGAQGALKELKGAGFLLDGGSLPAVGGRHPTPLFHPLFAAELPAAAPSVAPNSELEVAA